ncbi:phage tail terminator family protein [Cohnella thailandensis]|uniref:Tail terminator n=1 Tax=Cohnella thailandensis TaxID=557557 RepID=A0A841SVB1_9BACL|nr:hypothetical protein [Cohnella thailandensis]MBB6633557.1 hypothetical protein [Cohnella thailandensis]MBP1974574.1 hypothetical protein [Cohnella thailandensis]
MTTIFEVREAVIGTIGEAFPGMPILAEEIPQEQARPFFFVKDLPVVHSRIMGRRYVRSHSYEVQYFPSSIEGANQEILDVAERLTELLEQIRLGSGNLRGKGMRFETVEGVLRFMVTTDIHVFKTKEPVPLMGSASFKERVE